MNPTLVLDGSLEPSPVRPAIVWAEGVAAPRPRESIPDFLADIVASARADPDRFWPEGLRKRVRKMIRYGRYRPSGRARPSSEFLLKMALAGDFPAVNMPVDVNNAVSLATGYPASVFDLDLTGPELLLRRGLEGESYVFNRAAPWAACPDGD